MEKNQEFELTIEDMGVDGEGIGKHQGITFFVKDALIGDVIRAKVMKMKKSYGFARMMEILKPSPYRVEPKCPVSRQCGGCQIQALAYDRQLQFKNDKVKNNLVRIGGFENELLEQIMEAPIGMEDPYYYRNKAQFPVGRDRDGRLVAGFYAGRSHNIIPVEKCYLGVECNQQIVEKVLAYMKENQVEPYDEQAHTGCVRHILIRYGFSTKEIMVCLVINSRKLKAADKLVETLKDIPGMTSIMININQEKTNVILGNEVETLYGQSYITDYIGETKYQISPLSFYQVNPVQTEKLYGKALEYAGLTGKEMVWDLYCGIGTISLFLAKKAKKVCGVEIVPQAIEDAKKNAQINGIGNVDFFVGKAEEIVPSYVNGTLGEQADEEQMRTPDVMVVDPPRKGCDEALLETMLSMAPQKIVYVSCDSATLARDLKYLCEEQYQLEKVCAVDQFCHTGHVETVVLLSQLKQKPDDYINVTIELDDMDITSAETKATYDEIKKYVFEHNAGMKVSNLYISQVKRKCGIEVGKNLRVATRRMDCLQGNSTTAATDLELVPSPNLPKNEDSRQPQCPEDKERAIVEALEHFKMIQQE